MTAQLSAEDLAVAQQLGINTDQESVTESEGGEVGVTEEVEEEVEGQAPADKLEDLPESWQAEIRRLRAEAAGNRIKARQAKSGESKTAVEGEKPEAIEARVRESVRLEYGVRLAAADVKASLKGVVPDSLLDSIVGKLDLTQYVADEGTDTEAVAALHDEYVALLGSRKAPVVKTGHARTGATKTAKSTADQFADIFQNLS